MPKLSKVTDPLRKLIEKDTIFMWDRQKKKHSNPSRTWSVLHLSSNLMVCPVNFPVWCFRVRLGRHVAAKRATSSICIRVLVSRRALLCWNRKGMSCYCLCLRSFESITARKRIDNGGDRTQTIGSHISEVAAFRTQTVAENALMVTEATFMWRIFPGS